MMLVPRSFKYSSSPPREMLDDRTKKRSLRKTDGNLLPTQTKQSTSVSEKPISTARPATEPMRIPTKPVNVPVPERTRSSKTAGTARTRAPGSTRKKQATTENHKPDALPPSVAALLAMTAIPRPRPNQFRRRSSNTRNVSIDELVHEWKSDDSLGRTFGSCPSLSVLLEDVDEVMAQSASLRASQEGSEYLHMRSTSSDSIPSLEADDRSLLSAGSPSTPGSLRSRKSNTNLRKDTPRSVSIREEVSDHPLVPAPDNEDDDFSSSVVDVNATLRSRPSFKSNLTTSLQALKLAALSSISSLKQNATAPPRTQRPPQSRYGPTSTLSDEMLWSHPFLFPRLSHEMRPDIQGTPTQAQRRYLNPTPLTFEEQEAPFQQALHAPYLAEQPLPDAPTIQMQTYSRGSSRRARSGPPKQSDASSEAGRALHATGMRQREVRENSDFLRVVVLEMNMRREGKLEMGRARIWLPPRKVMEIEAEPTAAKGQVPRRWVGVSA